MIKTWTGTVRMRAGVRSPHSGCDVQVQIIRSAEGLPDGTWGDESGERCPWLIAANAVRTGGA